MQEVQKEKKERAVLVGLAADSMPPEERSSDVTMEELAALLETAGGEAVGWSLQNRDTPDPGSFIGSGKAKEIKELIAANDCDLAVFDNELSPSQICVLPEMTACSIILTVCEEELLHPFASVTMTE